MIFNAFQTPESIDIYEFIEFRRYYPPSPYIPFHMSSNKHSLKVAKKVAKKLFGQVVNVHTMRFVCYLMIGALSVALAFRSFKKNHVG